MSKVFNRSCRRLITALGMALALALAGSALAGSFEIVPTYGSGITPSAQAAIQYAVDSWNNWLKNASPGSDRTVAITFAYASLGADTMGESTTAWLGISAGHLLTPAQYIEATGSDKNGSNPITGGDGSIRLNSNMRWNTDTTIKAAPGSYDMTTIVMHEIGHHLGFLATYDPGTSTRPASWGYANGASYQLLSPWDSYLKDEHGNAPAAAGSSFNVLGTVTFNGPQAMAVYGGPVPVYTVSACNPNTYEPGSSLEHVEYLSGDNPAGLMSMGIGAGVTRRGMADYEQAMFADLGWTFSAPTLVHARGFSSGIWHDGSQWDYGLAPTAATDVRIDATGVSTYTVQVKKDSFAKSLYIGGAGRLAIHKGCLAVTGAVQVDNSMDIDPYGYGGSMTCGSMDVGTGHSATVNHYGGQVTVQGMLRLATGPGMTGTYTMNGGSLQAHEIQVGTAGSGTFTQSGGAVAASTVRVGMVGGGTGYYSNIAGTLQSDELYVTNGALNLGGTSVVTVNNRLELSPAAHVVALDGAQINLAGAAFVNNSTSPAWLAGLGSVSVVYSAGNAGTTFEVAGQDQGPIPTALTNNFALEGLSLGGSLPMSLRLVDAVDNYAGAGSEALYVTNLTLGHGAMLDLNGLHLYYRSGQIDPTAQILDGVVTMLASPGDANLDGSVNFSDYLVLESNFGNAGGWTNGDFNGNGMVDFSDYLALEANFGQGGVGSVPEPLTVTFLLAGATLYVRRFSIRRFRRLRR